MGGGGGGGEGFGERGGGGGGGGSTAIVCSALGIGLKGVWWLKDRASGCGFGVWGSGCLGIGFRDEGAGGWD
ncbi:hypothetical protein T484DRAFT_3650348 [Baffinella frigidus]|nr:hypothetical protein T484DRAFT_3650348 [Cryptophyta sp. CCMP2293]